MSTDFVQKAPLRLCDSCLKVDSDPRHVFGQEQNGVTYSDERRKIAIDNAGADSEKLQAVIRDLMDSQTQIKHMDCCYNDGCPDGACNSALNDPSHPFDGGKTTGIALSKKLAAHVEQLSKEV